MGLTPGRILGLLLGLGLWAVVQPTQPRRPAVEQPTNTGAPAAARSAGAPAASPMGPDSGMPEPSVAPARGAGLFVPQEPQAHSSSPGLDRGMLSGAVTTLDPLPPAGSRAERRAVRAAKQLARREARLEARRARFAALGLPPPVILASNGGRTDVSGSTRATAATSRSSDAPGSPTAANADGSSPSGQDSKSPTNNGSGSIGAEQIFPLNPNDFTADDEHSLKPHRDRLGFNGPSTVSANIDNLPTEAHSMSVFAYGTYAGGAWPVLAITVNGVPVGSITVNSDVPKKFYLPIQVDPGSVHIQVQYTNDFSDQTTGEDRNVYLTKIKVHAGI